MKPIEPIHENESSIKRGPSHRNESTRQREPMHMNEPRPLIVLSLIE